MPNVRVFLGAVGVRVRHPTSSLSALRGKRRTETIVAQSAEQANNEIAEEWPLLGLYIYES